MYLLMNHIIRNSKKVLVFSDLPFCVTTVLMTVLKGTVAEVCSVAT